MAFIYCITNNINGKQYIGKTHHEITRRWHEHIRAARKSTMQHRPLYAAIQKYGVQNFTITQLEECADEQTIEREQYWIRQLNTYHNGYNATRGGDGKTYINREMVIETYQNKPGRLYGEVSHITDVCNAKRSTAYGYKWRFTTGQ